MNFVVSLLRTLAVEIPVMLLCATVTAVILWRLRRGGYWLLLVGLALFVAFTLLGWAIAPAAMSARLHGGMQPAQMGIGMGCLWPTANFVFNRAKQGQQR